VPWYDERFVGYRKNKVVHLLYLSTSGIQFMVHPRAFTVHSPHPRARTWKVTHKTGLWDQVGTRSGHAACRPCLGQAHHL
jgi:glycosyltransferase-like protein LARGE